MKKFLYWPYQLYAWLIYIPLVGVITLIAQSPGRIAESLVDPGTVVDSGETVAVLSENGSPRHE